MFDAGVADGLGFIAMELLAGCDLAELVRREGPFGIDRSLDLILQVLEGVAVAHERGIVHRDLKPANVFVTRTEQGHDFIKLLDFGISKMRSAAPLTAPGLAMGTPGYMAPEQIGNARDVDGRADLFSVAVMLYELLTRQKPFSTSSYAEFVEALQSGSMRPLRSIAPGVPEALAAVVERGLARDPDGRFQTARDFANALRQAPSTSLMPAPSISITPQRSTPPISATGPTLVADPTPAPSVQTLVRPPKRNPVLLYAVLGALVAAGIGGAIVHAASSRHHDEANAAPAAKQVAAPKAKKVEAEEEPDEPAEPVAKKKAPSAVASSAGVVIEEPRVVGDLDGKEIRRVLKKALPEMEECRRGSDEHVMAAVHVHPVGKITLTGVAPDNKGNEAAARCVAQRFKEAATGWKQGAEASGILTFEVTLKAK